MGKTSVYLSDELDARWRRSGLPLSELVRRGLGRGDDEPVTVTGLRRVLREELAGVAVAALVAGDYARVPYEDVP